MPPEHAPPLLPFRDRPLSTEELQALRLVLSSYRDGSGQNQTAVGSMPGFRDFERGLASIVGGSAAENKGVFDVTRAVPGGLGYGVSCKMARFATSSQQAAFAELSNAAAKFRAHLLGLQINWVTEPGLAGPALIELVTSWHQADASTHGLDLQASKYAILSRSTNWGEFVAKGSVVPSITAVEELLAPIWPRESGFPLDMMSGGWAPSGWHLHFAEGAFGQIREARLANPQTADPQGLVAFFGSMGWVAKLKDEERLPLVDAMSSHLTAAEYVLPWQTRVQWTRLRAPG